MKRLWREILWWLLPLSLFRLLRDDCEICHGKNGGVWGNENVVTPFESQKSQVMCDQCFLEYSVERSSYVMSVRK